MRNIKFFLYKNFYRLALIFSGISLITLSGCTKTSVDAGEIISFNITQPDSTSFPSNEYSVEIDKDTIKVVVPPLIDRKNLRAIVSFSGRSIYPAADTILSFLTPIKYIITDEAGGTRQYVVDVEYAKPKSIIYFGAGNSFYAVDSKIGTKLWSFDSNQSFAYSCATYKDNVIYEGCIDGYLYAFNASNGRLLWKTKTGNTGIESGITISDSTVYTGCDDKKLFALNAINGNVRWSFATNGNISSSPVVADGTVYFGCDDDNIYALNSNTGKTVWSYRTNDIVNQSSGCLVNGIFYIGDRSGRLYAIDAFSGTIKWQFITDANISLEQSSPIISNGVVYIAGWYDVQTFSSKGSLYAIDASTGNLIWESLKNTGFSSSPYVNNNKVYVTGDDGNISTVDASTGQILLWQKKILANGASPVVADNTVYVGGGGTGYFYALDAATGDTKWTFAISNSIITSSPLAIQSNGEIVYPAKSGLSN